MADTPPDAGASAQEFKGVTAAGVSIALSDFRGKHNVVVFFFPKADSPG